MRNAISSILVACWSMLIVALCSPAVADGPAVSGPNGKLTIEGGHSNDASSGLALGSYTIPLGHSFGLQFDGTAGRLDNDWLSGGGVHLFTRDPDSYLLGVYSSYHEWNGITILRSAVEAELYLNRFSFTGLAGYESVNVPSISGGLQVLNKDDDHFFGHLDLAYYLTDDLKIYGGYRYLNETSLGAAGVEYLMRGLGAPISVFTSAQFGDSDHNRVSAGLKIYFSDDRSKSLMSRHRTEDPEIYTPVFPTLKSDRAMASGLPICSVGSVFDGSIVTPPTNCNCPSGTANAGGLPTHFGPRHYCDVPQP